MKWFLCYPQKRTEDLKNERKIVEDQMTLAKNELQKTEDLVKMLLDDKTVHLAKLFFFFTSNIPSTEIYAPFIYLIYNMNQNISTM